MRLTETELQFVRRRAKSLKADRAAGWEEHWKELSEFIEPFRSRFYLENTNNGLKSRTAKILAGKASRASRILSAGLMTGLTSPARPWFNLQTPDPDLMKYKPVKEWLDAVEQKIYAVFNASNYYQVLPSTYRDIGVFGTSPTSIMFDSEDIIRCRGFAIGEYWIAQDHRGRVDTFYREFKMTVSQLIEQFGIDRVERAVREDYNKGNYENRYDVCHLIERNNDGKIDLGMGKDRPWRNLYWQKTAADTGRGTDAFLDAKGMFDFPVTCPRWDILSGDTYGIAPAFDALPEVKQLQSMQRRKMIKIGKADDPPMAASNDLQNNRTSSLMGDVTYMGSANSFMKPLYQIDGNITPLATEIERVERAIDSYFYVDTFLMISSSGKAMTATEVAERQEEKLIQLGPTLTRLKDEKLDLEIKLVYNILKRNRQIPPPPQEIIDLGDRFEIEYISLLAQAQKAVTTTSIERTSAFASSIAAEHPDARHRFNGDAAIQRYANDIGAPPSLIRSDEEVKKLQDADAQAAARAEGMQMAEVAGKTAQSLANTNMTGENAFSALAQL